MFGFLEFVNPWFMVAGIALISAPIIIHLINRMRFRRLRWAAMEFLLKSQKRNRRRLIIEQLILLALRCLLIILAGLLVARYVFKAQEAALTEHLVIIDDTLSQTDHWKEGGFDTAFDVAKQAVKEIARKHSQADTAQLMKVYRLSSPDTPFFSNRLNSQTVDELTKDLDSKDKGFAVTALHKKPNEALDLASKILNAEPAQGKRVIHFVSDLRKRDWEKNEGDQLLKKLDALTAAGVDVHFVDTAHPARSEARQVKAEHDNLAITELTPESRVVVQDVPTRFSLKVNNFSARDLANVRVVVKVRPWLAVNKQGGEAVPPTEPEEGRPGDESERADASFNIHHLPPQQSEHSFEIGINQTGFLQVTTTLEHPESGLLADNLRYTIVEVRPQVPLLVIDGDYPKVTADGPPKGSGTIFLRGVFEAARGFRLESGTREDLLNGFHMERINNKPVRRNLDEYPCILMVNVPDLIVDKSKPEVTEKALKNLEKYVREGGGLAFFCGEKVEPAFYNKEFYKQGTGLFPAPLPDRPSRPLTKEESEAKLIDFQPKLFVRTWKHPMFSKFNDNEQGKETRKYLDFYFRVLLVKQYWPIPRGQWNNRAQTVEEVVTLPNERPVKAYAQEAQELLDSLPIREEANAAYAVALERHEQAIRNGLVAFQHLHELQRAISDLLTDRGDPKDPQKRPNLEEFWAQPANQTLRARFEDFRDRVQYGDPLVVSNQYGKGRVVAWMTSASDRWNNWANGEGIGKSFPILMERLQKYLGSPEDVSGQIVGSSVTFQLDETRYEPRVNCFLIPEFPVGDQAAQKDMRLEALGEVTTTADKGELRLTFSESKKPGVYCFLLYPKNPDGAKLEPERRAIAFNVDAEAEGDLKRAPREALMLSEGETDASKGKITIDTLESIVGRKLDRKTDFSQSPWLYLIILGILVAEQAMAVHLSFHLKGNEAQLPTQAAKSQQAT